MPKGFCASNPNRRIYLSALPERNVCSYCDKKAESWDHVIPQMRRKEYRGEPAVDNVVPACLECNGAKGCKPLIVFLAEKQHRNHITITSL